MTGNTLIAWLDTYNYHLIVGLTFTCIILVIITLTNLISHRSLKKRFELFMGKRSEKHNIETMLLKYLENVNAVDDKLDNIINVIDNINLHLQNCIQKVGIVRFNPFMEMGGDLSFSLAMLDEKNDGIVISTIFGREASYTYGKPIEKGISTYELSNEESQAIQIAINSKK